MTTYSNGTNDQILNLTLKKLLAQFSSGSKPSYPPTTLQRDGKKFFLQIRNSLKYVVSKDQKAFMANLKLVYKALSKDLAEHHLLELEEKWGKKYPALMKSWNNNWEALSQYFKYPEELRRIIYTTNIVEGFHRQIRKYTKNKGAFTSENALIKLIY